ncbi:MAG: hypothetical protein GWP17_07045 [Aquificales bacterium]|nr:hypothetical protein [Aquificales bacterium]
MSQQIFEHLAFLYGSECAKDIYAQLSDLLNSFTEQHPDWSAQKQMTRVSERDSILITYGDMVQEPEQAPLASLADFLNMTIADVISAVHILPFFPYSSDDGFSVIDYEQIDPNLGDWADVAQIGRSFRLMFDAVVNHISAESAWFQAFLQDDARYRDYFISVNPNANLTAVFRPRALPLLTEVETAVGPQHVWTTFSTDQIDLNYANPGTLLAVIKTRRHQDAPVLCQPGSRIHSPGRHRLHLERNWYELHPPAPNPYHHPIDSRCFRRRRPAGFHHHGNQRPPQR